MHKIILIVTITLITGWNVLAAQNQSDRFQQIKAHKVAYLTEVMDLTVGEAEKFWPIYNEYEESLEKIREDTKINVRDPNEEESKTILNSIIEKGERETALKRDFFEKASQVISYRKLYLMVKGEREFRVKLLERYKNTRKRK